MPLFEWEDGKEIEGIHEGQGQQLTIEDFINEDDDDDSNYEPSEVSQDDLNEQERLVEEIEENINAERQENIITDNEDEESKDNDERYEDDETKENYQKIKDEMNEDVNEDPQKIADQDETGEASLEC